MKLDRRVRRTRQLLRDALIELMLEKGYDDVTVQDITDRANVGRATFYLHYHDKAELLLSSLREVFDDLQQRVGPPSKDQLLNADPEIQALPFRHALENRDLYRVILLSEQGTGAITNHIRQYLSDTTRARMEAALGDGQAAVPLEIVGAYFAGAMIALIAWWLENNAPYSAEDMARMFQQLTLPLLSSVFESESQQNPAS